jgi:aspartyl-tRNA(Asn)/glutamyl-tRNA(Gln) amidotransferase subunit A
MTNHVKEFKEKKVNENYYEKLESELLEFNNEYHAFLNINKINHGFPFSAKANICVKGFVSNAGSEMLKDYVSPFNATAIERALENNFGFIGSTNMDEFGFGTFGINCKEPARNAFDKTIVAGGSSSGAAVAVAAVKYHIAIAESTGGSISAPSAFNGVVGFTPTYGAISRYGLIDYANSLDKIGIIARSAEDVKEMFNAIKGQDKYDSTCIDNEFKKRNANRLFVIKELLNMANENVKIHFSSFLDTLRKKGYEINEINLKDIEKAVPAYYIIAMAEASTNLAKYNGYKYGLQNPNLEKRYNEFFIEARENFGIEAKRRILLGTFIRSASVKNRYYVKALKVRRLIINLLDAVLKEGFIINPTMPITAPKIENAKKLTPLQNYALDSFTIPPNLAGLPHISFPYDYIDGMPLGAQIIGGHFDDFSVIDFVENWEKGFSYKFKFNLGDI